MDSPVDAAGMGLDDCFLDSILFSQEPAPEQSSMDLSDLLNSDPLPATRSSVAAGACTRTPNAGATDAWEERQKGLDASYACRRRCCWALATI